MPIIGEDDSARFYSARDKFLGDPRVREADAKLRKANVFDIINPNEIHYSRLVAWLCDPRGGHGQGDFFLKAVMHAARDADPTPQNHPFFAEWTHSDLDTYSFGSSVVFTEWQSGQRSIDIVVFDPQNEVVICIENKFGAGERKGQLEAYAESINGTFPGKDYYHLCIFLDWNEAPPSCDGWIGLGYDWLVNALRATKGRCAPEIGVILQQLLDELEPAPAVDLSPLYREFRDLVDTAWAYARLPVESHKDLDGLKAQAKLFFRRHAALLEWIRWVGPFQDIAEHIEEHLTDLRLATEPSGRNGIDIWLGVWEHWEEIEEDDLWFRYSEPLSGDVARPRPGVLELILNTERFMSQDAAGHWTPDQLRLFGQQPRKRGVYRYWSQDIYVASDEGRKRLIAQLIREVHEQLVLHRKRSA